MNIKQLKCKVILAVKILDLGMNIKQLKCKVILAVKMQSDFSS